MSVALGNDAQRGISGFRLGGVVTGPNKAVEPLALIPRIELLFSINPISPVIDLNLLQFNPDRNITA